MDVTMLTELCQRCGADSGDAYFDAGPCDDPCGRSHQRCGVCDYPFGACAVADIRGL